MQKDRQRRLRPLDCVLFKGNEPVSQFIAKVTSVFVVPSLPSSLPFADTWTHAGILVDSTVLPLPCLQPGKLYLYESILAGRILSVYEYSKVLPVDHEIDPKKGYHIGPQIREWSSVVDEVAGTVAVVPLEESERHRLLKEELEETRRICMEFYEEHKNWGYPLNPLPQFAAASEDLHKTLTSLRQNLAASLAPLQPLDPTGTTSALLAPATQIFCSEMVAKMYKALGMKGFGKEKPPVRRRWMDASEFTPLDLEVGEAMERGVVYVKVGGSVLLDKESGGALVYPIDPDLHRAAFPHLHVPADNWTRVHNSRLPASATPSGYTATGEPLYIARARVGRSLLVGSATADAKVTVGWEARGLEVTYESEVLVLKGEYEWVKVGKLMPGFVPSRAVVAGCDSEGRAEYVARARVVEPGSVGLGALLIGRVSPSLGGAKFVHQGKEITLVGDYEVLSLRLHFLERFFYGIGIENYLVVLLAMVFYILGTFHVHEAVIAWIVGGTFGRA